MFELRGALTMVDVLPTIRFLADVRQCGCLYLSGGDWAARLDFWGGRVVSAEFGQQRGLRALEALGRGISDAQFVYTEAAVPAKPELDVPAEALSAYLDAKRREPAVSPTAVPRVLMERIAELPEDMRIRVKRSALRTLAAIDGRRTIAEIQREQSNATLAIDIAVLLELGLIALDTPPLPVAPVRPTRLQPTAETSGTCPKLGFANDPGSNFDRPSAQHRCFATGSMQPVSPLDQRQFCLSGQHLACPRLREALGAGVSSDAPALSRGVQREGAAERAAIVPLQPRRREIPQLPAPGPYAQITSHPLLTVSSEEKLAAPMTTVAPGAAATARWRPLPRIAIPLCLMGLLAVVLLVVRPLLVPTQASTPVEPASATPPPPPTRLPTALATLEPTTVPTPSLQRGGTGPPLLDTNFSGGQPDWLQNPPFVMSTGSALRLSSRVAGRFVAVTAPLSASLADVQVSASFRKVGGPPGGGAGIIVRDQEPSRRDGTNQNGHYYVVEVNDQSEVGIWQRDNDRWLDVLSWSHSDAVQPGSAANDLTVRAVGNQLTVLVNGVEATNQTVGNLDPGGVGVYVGGDQNDVILDRFRVEQPPATAQ